MKSKSVWLVALALACSAIAWFVVKWRRARKRGPVTVQSEIERATVLGRRLQDLFVGKQLTLGMTPEKTPDRDKLLAAFWALVVDYNEGMLGLMRQKLYGSAFALLRPTMEALIRAHVVRGFPQADVDRIKSDRYTTDFGKIGAEIDSSFGYPGIFTRFLKDKDVLHSFTHSGMPTWDAGSRELISMSISRPIERGCDFRRVDGSDTRKQLPSRIRSLRERPSRVTIHHH